MSGGLPLVWLISKSEDCLVLHIEPEKTTPEGQDLARTIQVRHKLISVRFQRTRDTDANRDRTWPFRSNAVVRQWRGGVAFGSLFVRWSTTLCGRCGPLASQLVIIENDGQE